MYDRTTAGERTLPAIRRAAAFGRAAGAEAALISTGAKRDGALTDDEHAANIEGLREASRIVRDHGLIAYYHNHAYEFADDAVVLQRILDGVPAELLNLAFDTANAAALLPAAQVPAVIRRYRERIGYMHYKDCRGTELVEALGDGEIDFADVASALTEIDFSGWVVAELEGVPDAQRTVAEDTRRSCDLMRQTLGV
jgi:sugar phosphate isomerase/epimerase